MRALSTQTVGVNVDCNFNFRKYLSQTCRSRYLYIEPLNFPFHNIALIVVRKKGIHVFLFLSSRKCLHQRLPVKQCRFD